MISVFRAVPIVGLLFVIPARLSAQTTEIQEALDARLHALRTAAPLVLSAPAATIAIEEANIATLVAKIDRHMDDFWAKNKIKNPPNGQATPSSYDFPSISRAESQRFRKSASFPQTATRGNARKKSRKCWKKPAI